MYNENGRNKTLLIQSFSLSHTYTNKSTKEKQKKNLSNEKTLVQKD
jgi:hypothetical protein